MANPNSTTMEPRVQARSPGAWKLMNDNAVDTTGRFFIQNGQWQDGSGLYLETGWVRIFMRSTTNNLQFGLDSASASPAIGPVTVTDVQTAASWVDVFIGLEGSLYLKASATTVRASVAGL